MDLFKVIYLKFPRASFESLHLKLEKLIYFTYPSGNKPKEEEEEETVGRPKKKVFGQICLLNSKQANQMVYCHLSQFTTA